MNKARIDRLIELLNTVPEDDFSMGRGCLVWLLGHAKLVDVKAGTGPEVLACYLGVPIDAACHIYIPPGTEKWIDDWNRAEVIEMLTHLRDTGEVKWGDTVCHRF